MHLRWFTCLCHIASYMSMQHVCCMGCEQWHPLHSGVPVVLISDSTGSILQVGDTLGPVAATFVAWTGVESPIVFVCVFRTCSAFTERARKLIGPTMCGKTDCCGTYVLICLYGLLLYKEPS